LEQRASAVCFGTLAQRFGTPVPIHRVATGLRERMTGRQWTPGLVVFDVNMRGSYFDTVHLEWGLMVADWCKLNADELALMCDLFGSETLTGFVETMMGPFRTCAAIVTRGEDGCEIYRQWEGRDEDGDSTFPRETFTEPAVPARVVDTVGAGDAFTAAMVCLHLEGRPLRECARFANHYAARVCEHHGATPRIDRRDVEREAFGT